MAGGNFELLAGALRARGLDVCEAQATPEHQPQTGPQTPNSKPRPPTPTPDHQP